MGLNKLQVEFLRTKWWTYGFRASACSRTLPSRRRCGRSEWRMRSTRTPLTWVPFLRTACMSTKFSTGIYWTLLHKLINFILIYFFLFFSMELSFWTILLIFWYRTLLEVSEDGTESTAATTSGLNRLGTFGEKYFEVDHPFVFFLWDYHSGILLFLGRVTTPEPWILPWCKSLYINYII